MFTALLRRPVLLQFSGLLVPTKYCGEGGNASGSRMSWQASFVLFLYPLYGAVRSSRSKIRLEMSENVITYLFGQLESLGTLVRG
jgi:hypothetical protein